MARVAFITTDNRDHHRKYELASPYFGPAIEAVLQGLADHQEVEIHVISCSQQPMHAPEKLSTNTWFHLLHVPKLGWLRTAYQGCIRAIRQKLQQIQPDIVHGEGTERECAISAIFSGFPNAVTVHGNVRSVAKITNAPIGSYWWCAALLERFTLPRTNGVFCNSAYTESMVGPLARRTWRVPNALRREFFERPLNRILSPSKPRILNIGVVASYKRQLDLLKIAAHLHREGHHFEIQFVGAVPNSEYASQFVEQITIAQQAGFAHHVESRSLEQLMALYDSAAALVHMPSEEAFGLVVAEALARNLKVFGTKIGGLPDIADGIEMAELFPLGNDDALAMAIANWLRAGCPRPQSAAEEARLRYHPRVIAQRHIQIYREILAARATQNVS